MLCSRSGEQDNDVARCVRLWDTIHGVGRRKSASLTKTVCFLSYAGLKCGVCVLCMYRSQGTRGQTRVSVFPFHLVQDNKFCCLTFFLIIPTSSSHLMVGTLGLQMCTITPRFTWALGIKLRSPGLSGKLLCLMSSITSSSDFTFKELNS